MIFLAIGALWMTHWYLRIEESVLLVINRRDRDS